jgi:signal transduction histidine kinase
VTAISPQQMEYNIARCRVVLSVAAIMVVYIDPETPLLARWMPFVSGSFTMDARLFAVMATHLTYSVMIYVGLGRVFPARVVALTTWVDVLFAVAIAVMTEGVTSPAFPFFAFAVVISGLRGGLRQAMLVTTVNLALYLCLIVISARGGADVYIMRPVYLAITGYLVGYLGQQRLELLEQMRQLEVAEQRHRIGRELHDGYAQALAGINLRLEGARRLLRANGSAEVLTDLTDLQESVKREYDDLRRYVRSLAGVEATPTLGEEDTLTRLRMSAEVSGSVALVEHVLGIAREAISNVRRHARARTAKIEIREDQSQVRINIEDDGVGFRGDVTPWSIASRVKEIGGNIQIVADQRPGAHLLITLPQG